MQYNYIEMTYIAYAVPSIYCLPLNIQEVQNVCLFHSQQYYLWHPEHAVHLCKWVCTGLWCEVHLLVWVTQACVAVSRSTLEVALRDSTWWVKGGWGTPTTAIQISQLGTAFGKGCLKPVGWGWKWKQYCSLEQLQKHHKLARGTRQLENHKNFKTFSDDLAWPNHFTKRASKLQSGTVICPGVHKK